MIFLCLLSAFSFAASVPTVYPDFTALFQPPGEPYEGPVGGGFGYALVLSDAQATMPVVRTAAQLESALAAATSGDVVFVAGDAELDVSGLALPLRVAEGVTLASNRGATPCAAGALIYSSARFSNGAHTAVLEVVGERARVTGLRFRGPSGFVGDHHYTQPSGHVGLLLRAGATHLEFDNNEAYEWDKWSLYMYLQNGSRIHHNYFHHTTRTGFGYGVWCGGAGSEEGTLMELDHNIFQAHRHHIASHGGDHSWRASACVVQEMHLNALLDRHNDKGVTEGGHDTIVERTWIASDSTECLIVRGRPRNGGVVRFVDNVVEQRASGPLGVVRLTNMTYGDPQAQLAPNTYGNVAASSRPTALAATSAPAAGVAAGSLVAFDASASLPDAARVWWSMADGPRASGVLAYGAHVCHRFAECGRYHNSFVVRDAAGAWTRGFVTTLVRPPPAMLPGYILSVWLTDTCRHAVYLGTARTQIALGGVVLYDADVCASEDIWQHVVLDLTPTVGALGGGGQTHALTFRFVTDKTYTPLLTNSTTINFELCELYVAVDDVWIFGAAVQHGDFEANEATLGGVWKREAGSNGQYNALLRRTAMSRSGIKALWLERGYGRPSVAGGYVGAYQAVAFDAAPFGYAASEQAPTTTASSVMLDDICGGGVASEEVVQDCVWQTSAVRVSTSTTSSSKAATTTSATKSSSTRAVKTTAPTRQTSSGSAVADDTSSAAAWSTLTVTVAVVVPLVACLCFGLAVSACLTLGARRRRGPTPSRHSSSSLSSSFHRSRRSNVLSDSRRRFSTANPLRRSF